MESAETRNENQIEEEEKAGDFDQNEVDKEQQIQQIKSKDGESIDEELVDKVDELSPSPPMMGANDDQIVNESSEEPVFCSQDLAGYLHTQGALANQLAVTQQSHSQNCQMKTNGQIGSSSDPARVKLAQNLADQSPIPLNAMNKVSASPFITNQSMMSMAFSSNKDRRVLHQTATDDHNQRKTIRHPNSNVHPQRLSGA